MQLKLHMNRSDHRTVYAAFCAAADETPDKPFLYTIESVAEAYGIAAGPINYNQARKAVENLREAYLAAGYTHRAGEPLRIALMVDNRPSFFYHWFALNALGARFQRGFYFRNRPLGHEPVKRGENDDQPENLAGEPGWIELRHLRPLPKTDFGRQAPRRSDADGGLLRPASGPIRSGEERDQRDDQREERDSFRNGEADPDVRADLGLRSRVPGQRRNVAGPDVADADTGADHADGGQTGANELRSFRIHDEYSSS